MKIQLYSVDELVRLNKLEEVTNPITFDMGMNPTDDGLLSRRIFGNTSNERKETYAYINLYGHFISPYIYKLLKRLDRNFEYIVNGSKKFVIKNGYIVNDEEKGETGLEWLYKNWESIKFQRNYSNIRNERIDVLTAYKKDVLFQSKCLVCPPFYRDVNMESSSTGKVKPHILNKHYSTIISLSMTIHSEGTFDLILNNARSRIQDELVEIYNYLKSLIEKKNGLIRKNLLGKSVDYGSRSVITAPTFKANKPDEMITSYKYTAIPLSQLCSMISPQMVAWTKRFFETELEKIGDKYPVRLKDGSTQYVKLKKVDTYFNDEFIRKHLDRYVHSAADRFELVELPVDDENYHGGPIYLSFIGRYYEEGKSETESPLVDRPATWTDIFYQAAYAETHGKIVWITRYPILDYYGTFPTYIHVLSTKETTPMYVGNTVYKHYPIIDLKNKEDALTVFADTITMSNSYLLGNGGDYDGDQISAKVAFSQNACKEGEKIMTSKAMLLGMQGQNMRVISNECVQTLFMLTRTENE